MDEQHLIEERVKQLLAGFPPGSTDLVEFLGAQYDAGLAWVNFPEGYGGSGVSPKLQTYVQTELAAAGAPVAYMRNPIGYGMGAPTIVTHGSDAQKERYLRPLFTGEEIWCQLFSEPGAGSDVGGLATRAVRDGDEWIVNGQKVWTSLGHLASRGLLLARTDPDVPKHRGLTYFVADMHAPGVDVRPLRQMTGEAEFNEVYLTEVRVPDHERLGDQGDGWRVAMTTLMNERVSIGGSVAPRGSGTISYAVNAWNDLPESARDAARRDELMKLWARAETNRITNIRASKNRKMGVPGPEGSVGKLAFADLNKDIMDFTMNLLGPAAMLYDGYDRVVEPRGERTFGFSSAQQAFLRLQANSIEGGTSEIMRNILGERVLGLPGEPRVDKDVAWTDVPR
ncbi:MAG: putative acyl-CoA dehydrogenase [Actinomycetia bacterium]|nr:putative acyl-CoA dehydrogenase [Actinomycetes bacterium]